MKRWSTIYLLFIGCMLFSSCNNAGYIQDFAQIRQFHENYFDETETDLADSVDLFIDYSTCVAEAGNSPFYQAIHPAIIDCNPTFWSIKGNRIEKETDDKQKVYELLRSIREVNYADIKSAVRQIVNNDNQAIIITDGEYFQQNISGDNMNNPYLADEFRTWMKKGYDVYIFSEPYRESGRYDKFRYYMIFTNHKKQNNIFEIISRNIQNPYNTKLIHLSNSDIDILFSYKGIKQPAVNDILSLNPDSYFRTKTYEAQEYQVGWKDIYNYILNAYDDNGKLIEGGDYILRGIYVENKPENAYRITKVKAITYPIFDEYREFEDSLETGGTTKPEYKVKEIREIFTVDEDAFAETGEIVLKLHTNFESGSSSLNTDRGNLFKVEFVVDEVEDNFTSNPDIYNNFQWQSIERNSQGRLNTSLQESIRQALQDPEVKPIGKTVYSVYISTLNF